jgi:hypothetical protein
LTAITLSTPGFTFTAVTTSVFELTGVAGAELTSLLSDRQLATRELALANSLLSLANLLFTFTAFTTSVFGLTGVSGAAVTSLLSDHLDISLLSLANLLLSDNLFLTFSLKFSMKFSVLTELTGFSGAAVTSLSDFWRESDSALPFT